MFTQILKTAIAGILAGVALFMMPFFLLKVVVVIFLLSASFRLLGGRRRRRFQYAYAHQYHKMSDEERAKFRNEFHRCYGGNTQQDTTNNTNQ